MGKVLGNKGQSPWDRLGPGTLCSTCTWTNVPEEQIQRNYQGTKKNCTHGQSAQIINEKMQKGQNLAATSEGQGAIAGSCPWSLHTAPPRGWADDPSRPSDPTTLTAFKGPACPPQGGNKGTCCLPSLTPAAAQVPVKPCPNSYSGLSSISIIKESKDPGDDPSRQAQTLVLESTCSPERDLGKTSVSLANSKSF